MIKAVIFDCFGVLCSDGWLPFKAKYFANDQKQLALANEISKDSDARTITYDEFIEKVAKLANIDKKRAFEEIENNIPDQRLFGYITELKKKGYKIGMLSNAGDNWLDEIFEKNQVDLFDEVVLSYEVGLIKPDPEIYKVILKKINLQPEQTIFIDDQERYCQGAEAVGIKSIVYSDFQQMKTELEELLSTSNN